MHKYMKFLCGFLERAEAGPILSLLRLTALFLRPTLYVHSIYSCITIFYTDQPIPTIVVFLCECTMYDWLYMDFSLQGLGFWSPCCTFLPLSMTGMLVGTWTLSPHCTPSVSTARALYGLPKTRQKFVGTALAAHERCSLSYAQLDSFPFFFNTFSNARESLRNVFSVFVQRYAAELPT